MRNLIEKNTGGRSFHAAMFDAEKSVRAALRLVKARGDKLRVKNILDAIVTAKVFYGQSASDK